MAEPKLRSRRGETLVETLVAILVSALSVVLLVGGITAAAQINRRAAEQDGDFYGQLTAAEGQTEPPVETFTVTVEQGSGLDAKIPASLYGEGDLWAYARREEP